MCSDMRESICVQSMDGQLSVYEQDMFTFARFLPNILIPGPMGYVRKTNAIVTVTGDHKLEAFTYVNNVNLKVIAIVTTGTERWWEHHQLQSIRIGSPDYLTLGRD